MTGLQRARGEGALGFGPGLRRLRQAGSAKILLPRGPHPEAVLLNTAGGLTGGDRFAWDIAADAPLTVTTQAAERVYRSPGGAAEVTARLTVGPGARLWWLPQETILFDGARLRRRLEVDLAPDAELIALEMLVFGRAAMGEAVRDIDLRDDWRIRRGGVVHAEALHVTPPALSHPAALAGHRAMATLVWTGAEHRLEAARAVGTASAWGGRLVIRWLGRPEDLRSAIRRFLVGQDIALPRVWRVA